jgi:hypothetical protein
MLRLLLALLAALVLTAPASARTLAPLRLVDLTDDFETIWNRTEKLPDAERAPAFKAAFAEILPGFYSEVRLKRTPAQYDERLLKGLKAYPDQRADIVRVAGEFDGMFQPARQTFEAQFGPMQGYPPIYLVNSLGEFDGGTRELPGGTVLLFGADMIARYHAAGDVQPFFHHELFHLYHQRRFAGCPQIWCSLWIEGLAVHVAKTLNPDATDEDLLLTQPEPIRPQVEANRQAAVCAVVARLDDSRGEAGEALFSFRRMSPELPPRFGYYVGYLVAAELGKARTPVELAKMQPKDVRVEVERALRTLATCP